MDSTYIDDDHMKDILLGYQLRLRGLICYDQSRFEMTMRLGEDVRDIR